MADNKTQLAESGTGGRIKGRRPKEPRTPAALLIRVPGQRAMLEFKRAGADGRIYESFSVSGIHREKGWFIVSQTNTRGGLVKRICGRPQGCRDGWKTQEEAESALNALLIFLTE